MLKRVGPIIVATILLLLSGCINQEMSIAERQQCIDLSSQAFAFVPECSTQEQCFNEAQQSFFNFDESIFNAAVREELYSFKNHIALSWLYFNNARENAEAIKEVCYSKKDTAELPFLLNELNHELRLALQHSDAAFQDAFSTILLEENSLEKDEIELINEEPLFDSYIELNNNLNDLELQQSSGTFASHYLQQISMLQELIQRTGFSQSILKETTLLDLLQPRAAELSNEAQKRFSLRIPFLSDALDSFVSYLNSTLKIKQASVALQQFPSFEFFQAYNNLCGADNSSALLFSKLMQHTAENRVLLDKRNNEMEKQLQEKFSAIEKSIETLMPKAYSAIDSNIFSEVFSLLGKSSEITVQRFSISNLNEFKESAVLELNELKSSYSALKRANFLNEVSLGEKTQQMKGLFAKASELENNLTYLSTEIVQGMLLLCNERVNQIEASLHEMEVPSNAILSAADIKSRLNFKIAQFQKSQADERMLICRDILLEFKSLQSALNDFYSFKAELFSSFEECMNRTTSILSAENSAEFDLSDFKRRLLGIKAIEANEENIQMLGRFCMSLENDLQQYLQQSSIAKELSQKYFQSRQLFNEIIMLKNRFPGSVSSNAIEEFSRKFSLLGQYFTASGLNFANALPVLQELHVQINELENALNSALIEATAIVLSKTFSVAIFPDSIPLLGTSAAAKLRLLLESPLSFELLSPITISIPLQYRVNSVLQVSSNVLSAKSDGKNLTISLSSLPQGFTVVDLNSVVETSFTETTELLSIDSMQAILKKTISIGSHGNIPKLRAEIGLLPGSNLATGNVRVFSQEKSIPFSKEGNTVSFSLEDVHGEEKVLLYFSVESPFSIETEIIESSSITQSKGQYRMHISVQNLLPFAVNKIQLKLPLNIAGNSIAVREFVDSNGKKVKFEVLSSKNLSVSLESLPPGQKWVGQLFLEAEDRQQYWQQLLEEQKARANSLSHAVSNKIKEKADAILLQLNSFGEKFFESTEQLNELMEITKQLDALESEHNSIFSLQQQFNSLRNEISNKLKDMEDEAKLFSSLGFGHEAAVKENKVAELRRKLGDAEKLIAESNPKKALENIFEMHASLSSMPDASVKDFLANKKESLLSQFKELLDKAKKIDASYSNAAEQGILSLASDFDSEIAKGNFVQSKRVLDSIDGKVSAFKDSLDNVAKEKAVSISERIKKFAGTIGVSLPQMLVELTQILGSFTEEELIKAKYVSPVSLSRLKKISLEVEALNSPLLKEKINSFNSLFEKGAYADALELAGQFLHELTEKEEKALALENELGSSLQQIKEDALASFNSAANLLNSNAFNAEAAEAIAESETSLRAGKFLESIALSRKAVSLLSMPYTQQQQIPVYLYPILVAALLVFAVRFRRKKGEEIKAKKLERVLNAWNE